VPAPDRAARREIIDVHLAGKPLSEDVDRDDLARELEGYSGADVAAVVREAAMRAIEDVAGAYEGEAANDHADEVLIERRHFEAAIEAVGPSSA